PRRLASAWSVGWLPRPASGAIGCLRPDIIHLHWISQALSARALWALSGPVIWTHHDWGAFTGGCRCPHRCRKFESGCGACPLLSSLDESDLTRRTCLAKHRLWRALRLRSVAVGNGIAADVRASHVLGSFPVAVIPNGIDTAVFQPCDRRHARALLGMDQNAFVVVAGAFSPSSPWKGGRELISALTVWQQRRAADRVCIATVGRGRLPMPSAPGWTVHELGFLNSPQAMCQAYNTADVVVVPSLIESFGLFAAEAQSCGVPVVAFAGTGVSDIVRHGETGYLADGWSGENLAGGLEWAFSLTADERAGVRAAARSNASRNFDMTAIVQAHVEVYRNMILPRNQD
ncbi:MAG: glycosyltransferase, partial [Kiritimatiellae bacterium]|nr:glycosyltransferase [Kiritimatiellia bacterium]